MFSKGVLALLALLVHGTVSHLCLLRPPQRGDLDITEAGSHTCFRHGPPCGGQPGKEPTFTLKAGETFFFKWQQNFNHYEVGYPGYMDLAVAPINSTDFTFLAGFGDVNWHQQSHEQNYTVPAVVPDIDCKWCVLRARYVPHKPGEDTFYQCADIAITKELRASKGGLDEKENSAGRLKAAAQLIARNRRTFRRASPKATGGVYGLACNPLENPGSCQFVRVEDSGLVDKLGPVHYGVDAQGHLPSDLTPNDFILDQIATYDGENIYYIVHTGKLDDQTSSLVSVNPSTGQLSNHGPLQANSIAINALAYDDKTKQLLALQILEDTAKAGSFFFRLSSVDAAHDSLTKIYQTEKSEDLYVNYQWSTVDTTRGIFYYLMGNENDPYGLTARLYSVDIAHSSGPEPVAVNAKTYTIGAIQYDALHDRLVALSPGLYTAKYPDPWSIVTIDPQTGDVKYLCHVGPAGIFQVEYSGGIFNMDQARGVFYARLRVLNEPADVLVAVQLEKDTCSVYYSQLGNFYHIHNLAYAGGS